MYNLLIFLIQFHIRSTNRKFLCIYSSSFLGLTNVETPSANLENIVFPDFGIKDIEVGSALTLMLCSVADLVKLTKKTEDEVAAFRLQAKLAMYKAVLKGKKKADRLAVSKG